MSDAMRTKPRLTPARVAFQLVGFAISVGLFVWVIWRATSEENAESLQSLREASLLPVLVLLGATFASVVLNGLIFWTTLRPIRTLAPVGVVSVNAIATFLSILPFKIGFLSRALIHRTRDRMLIADLASWFVSVSLLGMSVFVPLGAISLWRGELDGVWWGCTLASVALVCASAITLGRASVSRPWLAKLSLGTWRIMRSPRAVVSSTAFRLMDVAALGTRFMAAGAIIGHPITPSEAGMHGTSFYLISVLSPAGVLGIREAASERLGFAADAAAQFALIALLVTFAELLVAGAMALAGAVYLRVDRLLLGDGTKKPLREGGVEGEGFTEDGAPR